MKNETTIPAVIGMGCHESGIKEAKNRFTVRRTVVYYELELVESDGGVICIDSDEYKIERDLLIVAKPGQIRRSSPPYRCRYVHILPSDNPLCRTLDRLPDVISLAHDSTVCRLMREAVDIALENQTAHGILLEPSGRNLLIYSRILEVLAILSSEKRLSLERSNMPQAVARVMNYIDTNPKIFPTLERLGEIADMNPIYLHRLFKQTIGITPYRFTLERKLNTAKNLLLTTEKTCQVIALELGFGSQANFTLSFRRSVGITPTEYRRRRQMDIFMKENHR